MCLCLVQDKKEYKNWMSEVKKMWFSEIECDCHVGRSTLGG